MQNDHDDEIGVNTQNDISFSKQSDRRKKKTPHSDGLGEYTKYLRL